MKKLHYSFEEIESCEMCGDNTANHKILGQRLNCSQGLKPKSKTGISVSVMKCTNCSLVYSQPMPLPLNMQDHYGISPEEYWEEERLSWTPDYFSGEINTAKKLISFQDGMKALDIGTGIGRGVIALKSAGFDAYGIEPGVKFREFAIAKGNINPEKIQLSSVEDAQYEPETFDFITYGAVFEHLAHPAKTLEKSLGWLKSTGVIHIEVPSSAYFGSKLFNLYFKIVRTNYVTHLSPMHSPFHLYEFDLKSFEELGKRLNFKIEQYNFFYNDVMLIPKIFSLPFNKYMEVTRKGMMFNLFVRKNPQ